MTPWVTVALVLYLLGMAITNVLTMAMSTHAAASREQAKHIESSRYFLMMIWPFVALAFLFVKPNRR